MKSEFAPVPNEVFRDANIVEDRWEEAKWRRCFVYADYLGDPIMDGGWLIGQKYVNNPAGETVLTLAVINTDHRVQIQTLYDNRLNQFK